MARAELKAVIGQVVHFPDGAGRIHQGSIETVWLDGDSESKSVRFTALCTDLRFREQWLTNCTFGAIPKPKKEDE